MSSNDMSPLSRRDLIKAAALAGVATAVARPSDALAQTAGGRGMQGSAPQSGGMQRGDDVRLYDPEKLPPSNGFSQVAEVTRGKVVYIAGQVPMNAAGGLVGPGDFRAQVEQVFANLDTAVRAAGGTFANVVKLNYFCVASAAPNVGRAVVEVRDRYVDTQAPPVSTFVFVSRLVRPEWLIEIEAVAVLPETSSMVVVLAQLDFDSPGIMQEALKLARDLVVETRAEDGCLHYAYATDASVPTRLQLSEWWRDETALLAHLHTPHLGRFRSELRRLGGVRSEIKRFDVGKVSNLILPPLEPR